MTTETKASVPPAEPPIGLSAAFAHGARVVAGASAGGVFAALLDAHFAYHAAATPPASRLGLLLADLGLVAPVAWGLGVALGVGSVLLGSTRPILESLRTQATSSTEEERRATSVRILARTLLSTALVVGLSHAARRGFGSGASARLAGASLSVTLLVSVVVADRAGESAQRLLRRGRAPSPLVAAALSAGFVVSVFALGIISGTKNGDGGFLGVLGVLGRDELDLRGVFLVSSIAGAALVLPSALSRVPWAVAVALSLPPLGALPFSAGRGLSDHAAALALERGAPLAQIPLRVFRKLTDRHHDGASARFGGGDCDDRDARVYPGADDVPGNGVDEDCSGADDAPVLDTRPAPTTMSDASWVRQHHPSGLSVVLVTVDTLRADLGYAGNPRPVSPNLDALAARSTVFENAYSLASYTGKSVGPLLLGKYPSETERNFEHFDTFSPNETFVQERLSKAGVRTLTAQAHWYFEPKSGLGRGFEWSDYSAEPRVPQMEGDRTVNGDVLTDRAIALLGRPDLGTKPFYLWLHYVDVHAAYVPHPGFDFGSKNRDLYDGEVAFVDAQIGRLLAAIAQSPVAEKTAILVTSDHGEAFGEHGMAFHGREVWEELVRVPLLVHVPGVAPHRVKERRSAIDVVPTLLDLASVPRPSGEGTNFVAGESLLPDLLGHSEPRPVLVDMPEGPYNDERQAFFDGKFKLIASRGRPLGLYDLDADPGERNDLLGKSDAEAEVVSRFKAFRRRLRSIPAKR